MLPSNLEHILLIEDDDDIAEVAKITLELIGGFDVTHFNSGQAAIDAYDGLAPQLILIDVMMPEMDGIETITIPQQVHRNRCAPFIFMTARAQLHEQAAYRALGALDVIIKPFDPMSLCQDIKKM
jgi:CheY-like chemotaxis protein